MQIARYNGDTCCSIQWPLKMNKKYFIPPPSPKNGRVLSIKGLIKYTFSQSFQKLQTLHILFITTDNNILIKQQSNGQKTYEFLNMKNKNEAFYSSFT